MFAYACAQWARAHAGSACRRGAQVSPPARARGARLQFSVVYPNKAGEPIMRSLGTAGAGAAGGARGRGMGDDGGKVLGAEGVEPGDFLDVSVT